jgi:protocatechuate 3,4-dioxygenase beta subunit
LETAETTGRSVLSLTRLPLDTDNDLLILNDGLTPAVGEITHLTGTSSRRRDCPSAMRSSRSGRPTRTVPTCIPLGDRRAKPYDANFQGYGRFLSDAKGQYYFRTIKPVEYTLMGMHRCPHIHVAVSQNGRRIFTSQFLVKGDPANVGDTVVRKP